MDDLRKDSEDYFCRFTFGQFVALILFEIVTLFFVFYLGSKFGDDLMGSGKTKVAQGKESLLPTDGPNGVNDIVGKKPVDYTYPDVLTGPKASGAIKVKPSGMTAEEFEKRGREPAKSGDTEEKKPEGEVKTAQAAREEPVGDAPSEMPPLQPVTETPARLRETPPPVKAAAVKGKYTIQVGSYQSEEEAQSAIARWKGKGYESYLTVGDIPNKGTWYRVRIGGFGDRAAAEEFLEEFRSKERTNALVVLSKN